MKCILYRKPTPASKKRARFVAGRRGKPCDSRRFAAPRVTIARFLSHPIEFANNAAFCNPRPANALRPRAANMQKQNSKNPDARLPLSQRVEHRLPKKAKHNRCPQMPHSSQSSHLSDPMISNACDAVCEIGAAADEFGEIADERRFSASAGAQRNCLRRKHLRSECFKDESRRCESYPSAPPPLDRCHRPPRIRSIAAGSGLPATVCSAARGDGIGRLVVAPGLLGRLVSTIGGCWKMAGCW